MSEMNRGRAREEERPPEPMRKRPGKPGSALPGSAAPVLYVGEQKLSDEDRHLVDEAYGNLERWRQDDVTYHDVARKCRAVYRLNDPEQDEAGTDEAQKTLQLQTLKSTINNCVADQMDNLPEAIMLPERPELSSVATEMTDVVRFILDQNNYQVFHRRRVEDFFIAGTCVTQIMWDPDMDNGNGNVALLRVPIENMVWDPTAEDIQDARAVIKLSWHPLSWYADHYPDAAPYVGDEENQHDDVAVPESALNLTGGDEGRAMLMEYWFRRYQNGRHIISVAYIAGGALLDRFDDVYAHGRYPFEFDAFTQIPGQPVGESMVYELTPMMRYINRYAHYIDENLRYACKNRMLVQKGSGIDKKQLADWKQNIVEGENISEDAVRWFDTKPLSGMVNQQMLQFQNDMKMDSGQNQFSRGETSGGVTAASAISALQEAGGKITRMRTAILSAGFKKIVEQIMWLVAEFYTDKKERLIVGADMKPYEVNLNADHLMDGHRSHGSVLPPPPYTVQVQIQRRNPMRVQAQNDLMIQAYTMAAQAGQNFPLKLLFELLNVDGKDRIMPVLEEMDQTQQMLQQMGQENETLKGQVQNMQTALDSYAQNLSRDVGDLQQNSFGGLQNGQTGQSNQTAGTEQSPTQVTV